MYHGVFHQISPKHLQRYVDQLSGMHNIRGLDTTDHMAWVVRHMMGKQLLYLELVG